MNNLNDRTRLPSPLRDEPYTAAIAGALGELGADALSIVRSVYEQLSPKTATWGLSAWEEITGILPAAGSTLEERRAAVVAQLRSRGTTNAEAIERLAASLTGYGAEVVENFGDYSFALTFLGEENGFVAMDLTLLYASVETIKPAHLRFNVHYVTWEDLEAVSMTWGELEEQFATWADLEAAVPVKKRG